MSNPFEDLRQAVVVRPMNSPGPQGPQGAPAPEVKIQYSSDGQSSWHDEPVETDRYIRFSTDGGRSWGDAVLFNNLYGYVIGPDSSTDGGIVVFDGTTGRAIKDSGEALSDVLTDVSTLQDDVSTLQDDVSTLQDDVSQLNNRTWDVIIEDQKPSGTDGGTFNSGAWITRDLNTLVYNHNSLASLSNNRFTLPAGTYCIDWEAPAYSVNEHKTLLYNYTTSSIVAYGTSAYSAASYSGYYLSFGTSIITIDQQTQLGIQHRCSTSKSDYGLGRQAGFGTEIYTRVRIKKIN